MTPCEILNVGFIDTDDDETDLGLAFAIYQDADYIDCIILARSQVYEKLLDESEWGVRFTYDEILGNEDRLVVLQEAILTESTMELSCSTDHRFTLDLSKLPGGADLMQGQP